MKEKLIYLLAFAFVFVLVSGTLIYFNTVYKNIFAFDFTPVTNQTANRTQAQPDSLKSQPVQSTPQQNVAAADSLKNDSTKVAKTDSLIAVKDTVKAKDTKVAPVQKSVVNDYSTLSPRTTPIQPVLKTNEKAKRDSVYKTWVKETCKLYETMDSKKAAKVIQGYSDNIARDILLSMKKKKAAQILSEIRPEVVTRIISVE